MRDLTLDECCALTAGAAMWSTVAVPEAGVPSFTMADGPMGVASGRVDERDIALLSPCPTALGATWDRALVAQVGRMIGGDAVARGVDALLAPTFNLARSPLAGRAFEYFSEDPLLAGVLGAAWITGLQSTGTGAIAKHMVCNDSETARDTVDVRVDAATLREVYLLPFELAAKAGCAGFLAAYNRVNGDWCSESTAVLTEVVRRDWGFDRVVMSDWFGTHSTDATVRAGLDLEMPGPARFMGPNVAGAVASGLVSEERVRAAAAAVAATARAVTGPKSAPAPEEADAVLEEAAAAGMVLLRNADNLLPLVPGTVKRLAVIGPNATVPCFQGGTFAKIAVRPDAVTPLAALTAVYGADAVIAEPGVDPQPRLPAMPVRPARDLGDGATVGMTLDYFVDGDTAAPPRFSETRATNSLVWFVGVHDQTRFDQPGALRASGRYVATMSGTHTLYLGATGPARLSVDGREVLASGRELAARDVMGVLKAGDADSVEVTLTAGDEVLIEVDFSWTPARVHGLWYGLRGPDSPEAMFDRAVAAARAADAVVLVVGETPDASVESKDRPDTLLPANQRALIAAVTAANPRTVVVANVGHAFDATPAVDAAGLLVAWYPGEGFGPALASVIAGTREPGGRLPVTLAAREADYPALSLAPDEAGHLPYTDGRLCGYRGLLAAGTAALYPFGAGQGYAAITWGEARVGSEGITLALTNGSDRAASEVVQLYRAEPEPALVGFAKVLLAPGETREVTLAPDPHLLRRWTEAGWAALPLPLALRVARHAEDAGQVVLWGGA